MNAETLTVIGIIFLSYALVVLMISFTPYYVRRDIAFGVSIPESEYNGPYFKKLRRQYLAVSIISGVLLAAAGMFAGFWGCRPENPLPMFIPTAAYLLASAMLYIVFHNRVRIYKENAGWEVSKVVSAALTADGNTKKYINPLWFLCYPAVIAATAVTALVRYPELPDFVPRHFNAAGQVDAYAAKSLGSLLAIPVLQLLITALFIGVYFMILRSKNQSSGGDPSEGFKKDRIFKIIYSTGIFVIGLLVVLLFGSIELSMLGLMSPAFTVAAPVAFLLLILAWVVYMVIKVGQGGSRLAGGRGKPAVVAADDSHWILGIFYFNREDPSVFVERRFGMGWTLNFARPSGWALIIALALFIVGILVVPFLIK